MPGEAEVGGWVPEVDRAPTDDDLLSDWAPRSGRSRGRRGSPEAGPAPSRNPPPARSAAAVTDADGVVPPFGTPALRLVRADPAGRSEDGRLGVGGTDLDENRPDADENWPDADEIWPDTGENDDGDEYVEINPGTGTDTDNGDERGADVHADVHAEAGAGDRTPGRARGHRINGRWGRFAELWVPESMREARVDPGRRGMLVLVLVAAVAAVVAAVGVWRDRPEPRPIETAVIATASGQVTAEVPAAASPAAAVGSAVPSGTAPGTAPAAAPPAEILVSVTGLVTNPGVVRLAADARVADAIAAAGGTQSGADLTGMNLAAKLADGDSVVVTATGASATAAGAATGGSTGAGAGDTATAAAGGLVNLNTADEAALDTLPGVGPVMAQNILAWRQTNGRFATVEQLQEISGIGPSRFAQLAPLVTVG